jgi:ABC-type transport system substrate-binding protein
MTYHTVSLARQWPFWLLSILIFWTACQPEKQEHPRGKTVVIQVASEPSNLHPVNSLTNATARIISYYLQQRVSLIHPATRELFMVMAQEQPEVSTDGLRYTYELDPKVSWNDGTAVTAEDVIFSLKAGCAPLVREQALRSVFVGNLQRVKTYPDNPRKFTLIMSQLYLGNPYLLNDLPLMDARFFDPQDRLANFTLEEVLAENTQVDTDSNMVAWAETFNDARYGSDPAFLKGVIGPYVVKEWINGQQIILARNENFWAKGEKDVMYAQEPDQIIFKIISEPTSVELQLKQDEIDASLRLNTEIFASLSSDSVTASTYYLTSLPRNTHLFVGYNMRPESARKQAFREHAVRKAFGYIVPAQQIIDEFYAGKVPRLASPISYSSPEYNRDLKPVPFSPDSAREVLEAAGWIDRDGDGVREKQLNGQLEPLRISLTYRGGIQFIEDMAQRIMYQAREVGMDVQSDAVRSPYAAMQGKNFDAVLSAFSYSDLPYDFKQIWHTENISTGTNFFGFGDLQTDSLIDAARVAHDPALRKQLVDEIQQRIYDVHPITFISNLTTNMAVHQRFEQPYAYGVTPYVLANALKLK